jgi:hypothetical protein
MMSTLAAVMIHPFTLNCVFPFFFSPKSRPAGGFFSVIP